MKRELTTALMALALTSLVLWVISSVTYSEG
jgi:hypothetical protein